MLIKRFILLAALATTARPGLAQNRLRLADSSAISIMRLANQPGQFIGILRQRDRVQQRQKLDEIADSLTARITQAARDKRSASRELGVLLEAGYGPQMAPGQSYPGSVDRLIRIHRETAVDALPIRGAAMQMLPGVVGFDRAAPYVRSIATSTDNTAYIAMGVLRVVADPGNKSSAASGAEAEASRVFLRQLWEKSEKEPFLPGVGEFRGKAAVPDGRAYYELYQYARLQGWTK